MNFPCVKLFNHLAGRSVELKWLAVFTMTVDHVAAVFIPFDSWAYLFARNLGRIAAPLFAYLLVAGFLASRDQRNYRRRLLVYALLSQLPFAALTIASVPEEHDKLAILMLRSWNVMVVLWASALGLQLWTFVKNRNQFAKVAFLGACYSGWLILSVFADNGGFIPVWVLVFYAFRHRPRVLLFGYLLVLALYVVCGLIFDGQSFPPGIKIWMLPGYLMVAVILCRFPAPEMLYHNAIHPPQWLRTLFYAWYPLHMLLISGMAYIIN